MVDYAKSCIQIEGYDVGDHATIAFTAVDTPYVIGTMAILSDPTLAVIRPGLARNIDTGLPGFTAQSVLFYATQNCLVRFNGPLRVQHVLLAGNFYTFHEKIAVIYVQRQAVDGILYVDAEG